MSQALDGQLSGNGRPECSDLFTYSHPHIHAIHYTTINTEQKEPGDTQVLNGRELMASCVVSLAEPPEESLQDSLRCDTPPMTSPPVCGHAPLRGVVS